MRALLETADWYKVQINDGVDLTKPGIYEWHIEGVGRYIGKFTHLTRPLREYQRNVAKLQGGLPYRPQKPDGFRRVHRELASAAATGRTMVLTILENVSPELLHSREAELIKERGDLNGSAALPREPAGRGRGGSDNRLSVTADDVVWLNPDETFIPDDGSGRGDLIRSPDGSTRPAKSGKPT